MNEDLRKEDKLVAGRSSKPVRNAVDSPAFGPTEDQF